MPVQHTLFGRPIPHVPPRRVAQLLGGVAVFALLTLIYTLPSSIPGPSLSKFTDGHRVSLPKIPIKLTSPSILHPFRPVAHAPPVQENSTSGEASWYSDWKWLSPFSSSVTLDENRSLLPPSEVRPPVYTYYDHTLQKDAETKAAESDILVTWRKAWWAQGFKPTILGPAEAMNNPLYAVVQKKKFDADLQEEMLIWLAWENMGTGIFCHYLALPMGGYDDSLLSYLRRGKYPKLTRYEGLGSSFLTGGKAEITTALKAAIDNPDLLKTKDVIKSIPSDLFKVDSAPAAVAWYDSAIITSQYSKVSDAITESAPKGWKMLNQLMNAHLHNTWQNVFSDGIIVLKPLPEHMTALIEPAYELAKFLSQCPKSPIPSSCPPNRPKCKFCVASVPMKISTPEQYRNASTVYTLGAVPHPYTRITLSALRETIDIPYIRRKTMRDQWISTLTKQLLGTGVSSAPRVIKFKEAVAAPYGAGTSLWFTAETALPTNLDWHFGFAVPRNVQDAGRSETPVHGLEPRTPSSAADPIDGPTASEQDLVVERKLLAKANTILRSKNKDIRKLRQAVEAWNLADSEAWRFARAFLARNMVDRLKWEEEEKNYAGGAGVEAATKQGWGRWFDSI